MGYHNKRPTWHLKLRDHPVQRNEKQGLLLRRPTNTIKDEVNHELFIRFQILRTLSIPSYHYPLNIAMVKQSFSCVHCAKAVTRHILNRMADGLGIQDAFPRSIMQRVGYGRIEVTSSGFTYYFLILSHYSVHLASVLL
jgi:hypothetical protein